MLSAIDRNHCPQSTGTPVRNRRNPQAVAEAALFLLAFAFEAFGRTIGNADAFDASRLRGGLVLGGVECSISRQQMRRASEQGLMRLDSGDQQGGIIWPPRVEPPNR